jgi:HSP20 family protein
MASKIVRRGAMDPMSAFDRFFDDNWRYLRPYTQAEESLALPLDVYENDDAYMVSAPLPGIRPEDIDVRLHDGTLTISAERKEETVAETTRKLVQERRYGLFSRSLRFPMAVNPDGIEASYENGVLNLVVPKTPEAQPRVISVRTK